MVSSESNISLVEDTHSSGHRITSNSLMKARRQDFAPKISEGAALALSPVDSAQLSSYMQLPSNTPMLLPETIAQNNLHIPLTDDTNHGQQQTLVELPQSAIDFQNSQLSPGNIPSNILQLRSLYPGNHVQFPSPRNTHIVIQGMKTLSALLNNARILRIQCAPPYARGLPTLSSSWTLATLSPTELQLRLPHFPYIDLLPFPSMRDKLLKYSECIDQDEIWFDLVMGGFIVWGVTPWDKRGWEVHADFRKKWWWLMTDEVLDEANYWRIQRGEEKLDVRAAKEGFGYSAESINFLKKCVVK